MLVNYFSAKCIGIDAITVTVEIKTDMGVGIHLVGLADTAVKESLLRTMTALQSLGFRIPGKKIIINLAPADLHKSGSGYDLPIALGILSATEQIRTDRTESFVILGELGLDASIRPVQGALPIVDHARKNGFEACILPEESAKQCCLIDGIDIYGVRNLSDAIKILSEPSEADEYLIRDKSMYLSEQDTESNENDFEDIIGQEFAKRGTEIAVAGGHNLMLIGPKGTGKSSIAKAITGILPPLSPEESIVLNKIRSVSGLQGKDAAFTNKRPFRAPHYSATLTSLIGGGSADNIRPGEVSLSHGGVLFIDEFLLMPRAAAEALRAPLEDRVVNISRLRSRIQFPSGGMFVVAANPCPCGFFGDADKCTCTPSQRQAYISRLQSPLTDRIDIQVQLRSLNSKTISSGSKGEKSSVIAERIASARMIQRKRFAGDNISTNAEMNNRHIEKYCPIDENCSNILSSLIERQGLSMRAYFRIIKVARTIADLENSPSIKEEHILEAASYRFLDRRPY